MYNPESSNNGESGRENLRGTYGNRGRETFEALNAPQKKYSEMTPEEQLAYREKMKRAIQHNIETGAYETRIVNKNQ